MSKTRNKQKKRNTNSFRKGLTKKKSLSEVTYSKTEFYQPKIDKEMFMLNNELKTMDSHKFFTDETLKNVKDLRFVISTDKIQNEIKGKVKDLLKSTPPRMGQCLWYSKFISSQIEGVKQVLGLFELKSYESIKSFFPTNKVINFNNTRLVKDENNIVWGLHSWNEYKGVHFDCLKDGVYNFIDDLKGFKKYRILKTIEFKSENILKTYMNSNYEFLSGSLYC